MHPNFKVFSSNDSKSEWFHYCKEHQIPYITIDKRTSLADIELEVDPGFETVA